MPNKLEKFLKGYFTPVLVDLLSRSDSNSFFARALSDLLFYLSFNEWIIEEADGWSRLYDFNHNALWSFPKSGNHWVRFISEYLTGCPTRGCITNPTDIPIYLNTFPSEEHPLTHVNPENPSVLYKSHKAYKVPTSTSSIVLLIRNYHTHISSLGNLIYFNRKIPFVYEAIHYLELIAAYDRFGGDKIVIYYEDLLTYSEREISRIKYFFNTSDERYKAFMDNYDYYAELSKRGKNRVWFYSDEHSEGLADYQKKLTQQDITARKNVLRGFLASKRYQCVRPYLARYE